jgi:pimeloyl-ACP methyl ester carboxylesterase
MVPELSAAVRCVPPHQPALAEAVRATLPGASLAGTDPVTLVGHSRAGPLLPGIAAALGDRVEALIYVDARLPYPGRSWRQSVPQPILQQLEGQVREGVLPPWNEWFPPGAVEALLPDPAMRAAFIAEQGQVPVSLFTEPTWPGDWSGAAGYLLLSEGYREEADAARAAGLEVAELLTHHLAILTHPEAVTEALAGLLARCSG